MNYRLVFTDLDGTLLDEQKQPSARTLNAVAELTRAGVPVVLTTARPPRAVAGATTGHHAEDGWATAIERYVLQAG